jgi:streptogramin lyase
LPGSSQIRPVPLNFRVRSIQQTGTVGSSLNDNAPYTGAGLRGDGQLGSIGDTGLDLSNCYFTDSSGATPPISTLDNPSFCDNCRKVAGYLYNPASGDSTDMPQGHGSHTSGTMLGSIENADITTGTVPIHPYLLPCQSLVSCDTTSCEQIRWTI